MATSASGSNSIQAGTEGLSRPEPSRSIITIGFLRSSGRDWPCDSANRECPDSESILLPRNRQQSLQLANEANRGLPHAAERTIISETWTRGMLLLQLEMGRESSRPIELGKRGLSKSRIGPQPRRWR